MTDEGRAELILRIQNASEGDILEVPAGFPQAYNYTSKQMNEPKSTAEILRMMREEAELDMELCAAEDREEDIQSLAWELYANGDLTPRDAFIHAEGFFAECDRRNGGGK